MYGMHRFAVWLKKQKVAVNERLVIYNKECVQQWPKSKTFQKEMVTKMKDSYATKC